MAIDGWRKVIKKKVVKRDVGAWDVAVDGRRREVGAEVTNFFITQLGDNWKARDLLFELKELRKIVEVVIPSKRDRRGRRYGFTRYVNVVDENLKAIKLDSVILEGRKMFANLPRFQRPAKFIFKGNNTGHNSRVANISYNDIEAQGSQGKGWVDSRSFTKFTANKKFKPFENGESLTARVDECGRGGSDQIQESLHLNFERFGCGIGD